MRLHPKTRLFLIILIIVSGLAFSKVVLTMWDGNNEYLTEQNKKTKPYLAHETYTGNYGFQGTEFGIFNSTTVTTFPNTQEAFVNTTITHVTIPNATFVMSFYVRFNSPEVFAVDNNINYTIMASVYPILNIKEIYVILDSSHNDIYQNKTNIPYMMSRADENGELVKLKRENTTFFAKRNGNWTDPIEDQISIFWIIDDGQNKTVSPKSPFLLTIAPHLNKLQADTDLDIQNQNLQSIKSNNNVEVLTWLIIALIPIGFMIELVIHGYLIKDDFDRNRFHDG